MFGLLVGEVRGQSLSGCQEFLLVDDVVPIEHGPRLVAGEQHGDPLRYARADQVPCRGASTIVEEPMRDLGLPAGVAQGVAQGVALRTNRDAVASKHARIGWPADAAGRR